MIIDECGVSRSTFYRHFKDKYDLVNWIFDIECISAITRQQSADRWALMEVLVFYFYENKTFYQKIIKIKGQNSFSEHFREFLYPIMRKRLDDIVEPSVKHDIMTDFLTDTCICAIERWLSEKAGRRVNITVPQKGERKQVTYHQIIGLHLCWIASSSLFCIWTFISSSSPI